MRKTWLLVVALIAGCDNGPTGYEQAVADARDVAMVEAANDVKPPLKEVAPEPIMISDIERWDLFGEACNYAPGTSFGTRVIARESDAFLKVDGDVVRLAADPGSRELPAHSRTLYSGKEYSLRLALNGDGAQPTEPGKYEGTVTLRDEFGRIVYEGTGFAECKTSEAPA
jgi:hypothetical protein